jgi:hypothetical protein
LSLHWRKYPANSGRETGGYVERKMIKEKGPHGKKNIKMYANMETKKMEV